MGFHGTNGSLAANITSATDRAANLMRKSQQANLEVDGIDNAIAEAQTALDLVGPADISLGTPTTVLTKTATPTLITTPVAYARTSPVFQYWGNAPGTVLVSYTGNTVANGRHCSVKFETNSNTVAIRMYDGGITAQVYVDGKRISARHIKPSEVVKDASGNAVNTNTDWMYEFVLPTKLNADNTPAWRTVEFVGFIMAFGAAYVETGREIRYPISELVRRKRVWQLGDSYTHGVGPIDSSFIDLRMFSDYFGWQCLQNGIGGSGWTSTGGQIPATRVTSELGVVNYKPDIVILSLGYNTYANGIANEAAVVKAMDDCIAAVKAIVPDAQLLGISCATPVGMTANLAEGNRVIGGVYAKHGIPFLSVTGAITAGNSVAYAGDTPPVHPNQAGFAARARALIPELRKYIS